MDYKNEIGCQFILDCETDHPDVITNSLRIEPTSIQVRGEQRKNSSGVMIPNKFYDRNIWLYDTGKHEGTETFYINHVLSSLLDKLNSSGSSLKDVLTRYPQNHILCYAYYTDFHQYFSLEKNLNHKLADLNLTVEFDVYFLKPD